MNPFYIWLGLWLYIFNRQRFGELSEDKPKAEILEFKRRA